MPDPGATSESTPAWTDAELARSPHENTDKPSKVRAMFAAIAPSYDLNNRLHSFGRDRAWRRFAVRAATVKAGDRVLDIACGTGDLTEAFAETGAVEVVGADFTPEMLAIAWDKKERLAVEHSKKISYVEADAQSLHFPDTSFDVVSIAFGIRNVGDPARALSEFARVLNPGGRLIVLEFDQPRQPVIAWFHGLYTGWIMPRTAALVAGDKSGAYKYLPKSVGAFMSRDDMARAIAAAGFSDVTATPLTMGVCVCYRAVKK
jgi:demethylmenaquinone methyltransferase/2-methoxy-6-polyprenyl-1,4-benzoquinol methylase